MPSEERVVQRPHGCVAYDVLGDGPPVVLGHSLLCDARMWEGLLDPLAERFRVLNVEFRGHRRSRADAPFALDDLVEDYLAVLDAEGLDRAAFCGLSMGGMVALRLALRYPERVGALAILDSNAGPEGAVRRLRFRLMAEIYRRAGLVGLLQGPVLKQMLGRSTLRGRPELAASLVERIREHDPVQLYRVIRAVIDRGAFPGRLGDIACPTLVLVGDEDVATPPERSRRIQEGIAGAKLHVIPAAGHLSALEQPETVLGHLLPFLERHLLETPVSSR